MLRVAEFLSSRDLDGRTVIQRSAHKVRGNRMRLYGPSPIMTDTPLRSAPRQKRARAVCAQTNGFRQRFRFPDVRQLFGAYVAPRLGTIQELTALADCLPKRLTGLQRQRPKSRAEAAHP